MKQPFENLIKEGDSITVPNFMSITTNFKVALGFSGIGKVGQAKCCVYKILISNGVPYINMINTTKYKHENETLLPRNLKLTLINKATLSHQFYGEIPVIVIRVSLQNNDQFKIHSGCSKFYLGKLISVKSSYLDLISKTETKNENERVVPEKVVPEKKNIAKKQTIKSKRCANGTRKNKISGLCEPIPISFSTSNSYIKEKEKENEKSKQKTKSKRCPNGTHKNKKTGLCEKYNKV
jgi:hypothetical protein